MKRLILSLAVVATAFWAQSQVICSGVSPANVSGNYDFEWADPGGGDWACPDFLVPGTFVQDTLAMAEDGTAGDHVTYGHPLSQQACNPLNNGISDVTGKIAVLYRGDCEFGAKALNAETAGAVAVIIVNHTGDAVPMGGGVEGLNVTIPVVMVSEQDGADIIAEMQNGPVVFFLGNKVGAFQNDAGSNSAAALISRYGGASSLLDNTFDLGIEIYNFGAQAQSNITVTASIDLAGAGNVYSETINAPTMATGDTLSIFVGNPIEFTPYNPSVNGVYTLTYSIDLGVADDSDFDNVLSSTFTVNDNVISLSRIDASENPVATNYPSNSTTEYQSCMFFVDPNASSIALAGITFIPYIDTANFPLGGEEIIFNIYEWNDAWIDLADPAYVGGANNDWFTALNPVGFESYYPTSNSEVGQPATIMMANAMALADNQRYLFCLQSFNPEIGFGYDGELNYDGNQGISAMPISPVFVDDTWYTGGWVGSSATSMTLHVTDVANIGVEEVTVVEGKAFPNPANDVVTVSVNATGNATLTITDIAGKVAMNDNISLENGTTQVNIDALEAGVYVFNVVLENGLSSQFNVVKK